MNVDSWRSDWEVFTETAPHRHPFEPLSVDEIARAGELVRREISTLKHGDIKLLFSQIVLAEPSDKELVLKKEGGLWLSNVPVAPEYKIKIPRLAEVVAMIQTTKETAISLVQLGESSQQDRLASLEITKGKIQPAITSGEYTITAEVLKQYPPFIKLCRERGLDISKIRVDPWCPGYFTEADAPTKRLLWPSLYYQEEERDNIYARPLGGLEIMIDIQSREVIKFQPIPGKEIMALVPRDPLMNYETAPACSNAKKDATLKPLHITQPEGASFTVSGRKVEWQGWSFYVGFTSREGLVLHLGKFRDRPVFYRSSFAEMVVPYGDPEYPNFLKNAFDAGEDGLGRNTHSLTLGCDCKGLIYYFDAFLTTKEGTGKVIKNAICMHEEDDGIAWKHMDWRTGHTEVRRRRKLVISFVCTIANYEYGFYVDLHQNASVHFNVKLTGIVSTSAIPPGQDSKYGTTLFRGNGKSDYQLMAPTHQHYFVARIDMAVDGLKNNLYEVNVKRESPGEHNPHLNGFYAENTHLENEKDAIRDCNTATSRHWLVQSTSRKNRVGEPTGYVLHPFSSTPPLGDPRAMIFKRAGFLQKQFWATPFNPKERFPGGDFPNQCNTVEGLPKWTQQARSIIGSDLVLWHIFGVTHVVRLEDWPVMPAVQVSFKLEPFGFFDCSPIMDLDKECKGVDEYAKPVPQQANNL